MLNIQTVSVIGANGTMGATVAGLIAAFGNAKVFLICRKKEAALKAVETAVGSVRADSIRKKLIPCTYEDFESCVGQSDWVFESVAEDTVVKSEIYQRIERCRKPELIVTTGTSGFSINELGKNFNTAGQKRFFGTHFFNPPYVLTLCEVIRTGKTDPALFSDMQAYLEKVLHRDVIETADAPAFLGNRIGFHFLNKALQYAVRYSKEGGIDYIDAVLGPFTGRGMTPLITVDFVGLDVHKAIVDNIYAHSMDYDHSAFLLPDFVLKLIAQGKLGVKTKEGFFKTVANGDKTKQVLVYDIASGDLRPIRKYKLPFAMQMVSHLSAGNYGKAMQALKDDASGEALICRHFLASYIAYAFTTAGNVSPKLADADIAMTTGFNWIGPLALTQALGGYGEVLKMAAQADFEGNLAARLRGIGEKGITAAPFDYRKSLRAVL